MTQRVALHIDELVLDGVLARDANEVARAAEVELARLLAGRSRGPLRGGALGTVDGGPVTLAPRSGDAATGKAVANAVHGALPR